MFPLAKCLPLPLPLSSNPADLAQLSASGIRAPASRSDGRDRRQSLRVLELEGPRPVEATGWH
jgi:hypothetical protein